MRKLEGIIKNLDIINENEIILFCFPYAGGGASVFYNWSKKLKEYDISVCPIQLPGREDKILESPYTNLNILVRDLVKLIRPFMKNKVMFFGHSMGAKIAFEVGRQLEKEHFELSHLIVSGSRVPHIPEPYPIYHLPDKEFKHELKRFGGISNELLVNEKLFNFFLPVLRADFTMSDTYHTYDKVQLTCPVLSFGGDMDSDANQDEIFKWSEYTVNDFKYRKFSGDHFFIRTNEDELLEEIRNIV